jgi:hypothetical protein
MIPASIVFNFIRLAAKSPQMVMPKGPVVGSVLLKDLKRKVGYPTAAGC